MNLHRIFASNLKAMSVLRKMRNIFVMLLQISKSKQLLYVIIFLSNTDGVIKVWDYSTGEAGKSVRSVHEHEGFVTAFLFW